MTDLVPPVPAGTLVDEVSRFSIEYSHNFSCIAAICQSLSSLHLSEFIITLASCTLSQSLITALPLDSAKDSAASLILGF